MNITQATGARKPRRSPGGLAATAPFMRRTLYHMRNNGFGFAMEAVLSPIVMLLIFAFLFGGAITGSVTEYIQYLLPGILVLTMVPMTVYSGTTSFESDQHCRPADKGTAAWHGRRVRPGVRHRRRSASDRRLRAADGLRLLKKAAAVKREAFCLPQAN